MTQCNGIATEAQHAAGNDDTAKREHESFGPHAVTIMMMVVMVMMMRDKCLSAILILHAPTSRLVILPLGLQAETVSKTNGLTPHTKYHRRVFNLSLKNAIIIYQLAS